MRVVFAVLLLLLAVPPAGLAQDVSLGDLYAAEVPLPVRDQRAVDAAFDEALERVLLRVTGRRDVAEDPQTAALRGQARALVEQWSYTRQGLWARFDAIALERELRALGLPVWGAERPLVLAWIALDDDQRPAFLLGVEDAEPSTVGPDAAAVPLTPDLPSWPAAGARDEDFEPPPDLNVLRAELADVASLRGLPLALPRLDIDERLRVTPELLCGAGFASLPTALQEDVQERFSRAQVPSPADDPRDAQAARRDAPAAEEGDVAWRVAVERYRADAMLVGCARWLGDRMVVDWTLQLGERNGEARRWRGDLQEGPHGATDVLARAMAPLAAEAGRKQIRIEGIASLQDYGRVMRHLEGLSLIDAVDVQRVSGDTLHLSVRTRADDEQLRRALLLGRTLQALPDGNGAGSAYALSRR
jgi:uncharacterized protein